MIIFLSDIGTTELNNTTKIIEQIKEEHLYVCVIFVGSNLDAALNILNAQTRKRTVGTGSPLIIHYHPSFSTVKYNLSQVTVTKVRSVLVNARGPTIRI